jgi:putative methyltransferase (TIGR04325 family)
MYITGFSGSLHYFYAIEWAQTMIEKAIIIYRRYFKPKRYGWFGDYANWQEAKRHCSGYDSGAILQKVTEATVKVKSGEAVYERDGVLFDHVEYSWPLLSALLWVAAKNDGKINVVDFGGALGSSYFQNKNFLDTLKDVRWNIIEQENFVTTGREQLQDNRLRFYFNMEECIARDGTPDLLIMSCALQYMERPYELIDKIIAFNIPHIIVDNTAFNFDNRDRITIQKVPPAIYTASYPCWFLNYLAVKKCFEKKYSVVSEHTNDSVIELDGKKIQYKGLLLELKK